MNFSFFTIKRIIRKIRKIQKIIENRGSFKYLYWFQQRIEEARNGVWWVKSAEKQFNLFEGKLDMTYQLPKEELDFFVNFGKRQGSRPTFMKLLEKIEGIDIKELKEFFSELEKDINEKIEEEDIEKIKNIKDPKEYEKFLEQLAGKIPTEKYEFKLTKLQKSINKALLRESLKKIVKESYDELKETEGKILRYYGTYPGDLTFLWFYFSTNVHKTMEQMVKTMDMYSRGKKVFRRATVDKHMSNYERTIFDVSYGFMRLSAISSKALDGSLEEEDLVNLETEIFDLTSKISPGLSYEALDEKEQKVISALITA